MPPELFLTYVVAEYAQSWLQDGTQRKLRRIGYIRAPIGESYKTPIGVCSQLCVDNQG